MGVVNATHRQLYTRGRDPVPIVQEAGWAPGAGLDGCEKSHPHQGFDPQTVQPVASRYPGPPVTAVPFPPLAAKAPGRQTVCYYRVTILSNILDNYLSDQYTSPIK